jgi:hypothetical protein
MTVNFHWQTIKFMPPRSGQYCDMPNTMRVGREVRLTVRRHRPYLKDFRCYVNGILQPCSYPTLEDAKRHCQELWLLVYGDYVPNYHDNKMNERDTP